MGAGGSREQHTFNADAPVSFSQSLLDSLQSNPETDSTRAQATELKIQHRVNTELTRIRDAQAQRLADLTASLTTNPPPQSSSSSTSSSESTSQKTGLAAHLSSPFYQSYTPTTPSSPAPSSGGSGVGETGRSHDSVQSEIMSLKEKLASRKKVEQPPAEVERAREGLVMCLRRNDRRPLDCWREVEEFKRRVGEVERKFVEGVGR